MTAFLINNCWFILHRWCDYVSPVWSWTGDPLWRDFANQQTVTWTADILLSNRSVLYWLQRDGWYTKKEVRKSEDISFSVQLFQRFRFDVISRSSAHCLRQDDGKTSWDKKYETLLISGWWNVTLSITEEQWTSTLDKTLSTCSICSAEKQLLNSLPFHSWFCMFIYM